MLDAHSRGLAELAKWLHNGSREFRIASAVWLNRAAYHTRELAQGELHENLIIRSGTFLASSLRYTKVRRGARLAAQVSYVGSVARGKGRTKTTGWAEQEGEAADKRDRTITVVARMGNKRRKVAGPRRLKAKSHFRTPLLYRGRSARARALSMLNHLEKTGYRKPFVLFGLHGFRPGLYLFRGKKLHSLQLFGKKPASSRRVRWLGNAKDKYLSRLDSRAVWSGIVRRIVKGPGK